MTEFEGIAEKILKAGKSGKLSSKDQGRVVGEALGMPKGKETYNCYPGVPGENCYELAFFIALKSPEVVNQGRTSKKAFEEIVNHMFGYCQGFTRVAVMVTDNWDPVIFNKWKQALLRIKREAHLEIYFIEWESEKILKII